MFYIRNIILLGPTIKKNATQTGLIGLRGTGLLLQAVSGLAVQVHPPLHPMAQGGGNTTPLTVDFRVMRAKSN